MKITILKEKDLLKIHRDLSLLKKRFLSDEFDFALNENFPTTEIIFDQILDGALQGLPEKIEKKLLASAAKQAQNGFPIIIHFTKKEKNFLSLIKNLFK